MTRVLVDTTVWIDHLHRRDDRLAALLEAGLVVIHPMIIGELALGGLRDRRHVLQLLKNLPQVVSANSDEVLALVESRELHGRVLSLVDAHLLASALISGDVRIWTRDRRLRAEADGSSMGWPSPSAS